MDGWMGGLLVEISYHEKWVGKIMRHLKYESSFCDLLLYRGKYFVMLMSEIAYDIISVIFEFKIPSLTDFNSHSLICVFSFPVFLFSPPLNSFLIPKYSLSSNKSKTRLTTSVSKSNIADVAVSLIPSKFLSFLKFYLMGK